MLRRGVTFCRINQFNHELLRQKVFTSSIDTPSFKFAPLNRDLDKLSLNKGKNIDYISTTQISHESYYYCSITIQNSSIFNVYAFNSDMTESLGGCLYAFSSNILVDHSFFVSCRANSGGAIATIKSTLLIKNSEFYWVIAYTDGAAVYFQGVDNKQDNLRMYIQIINCWFMYNTAYATGGAVSIEFESDAYFENAIFEYNNAFIQGGAIAIANSHADFFNCKLFYNSAGNYSDYHNSIIYQIHYNFAGPRFFGRGCAGISFISTDGSHTLHTQNNCFRNNKMERGVVQTLTSQEPKSSLGVDIMFEGKVIWISFGNYYSNYSNAFVFIGKTEDFIPQISQEDPDRVGSSEFCVGSIYDSKNNLASFEFAKTDRIISSSTSSVPSPSLYTYQATPITRLPYKTTKSLISQPPSKPTMWTQFSTITIRATYPNTPFETPFSTAHNTPVETVIETPHETVVETPFITPVLSATMGPTAMTPEPTRDPLYTKTNIVSYSYKLTAFTFTNISTFIPSTLTYIFTLTSTISPTVLNNVVTVVYGNSYTTTVAMVSGNTNLLIPTFGDKITTIFELIETFGDTKYFQFSSTTEASNVLSATFISTDQKITLSNKFDLSSSIFVYSLVKNSSTVTYTSNDGTVTVTKIATDAYTMVETNKTHNYYTLTSDSSITLTSLPTNYSGNTFTLSVIYSQTVPRSELSPIVVPSTNKLMKTTIQTLSTTMTTSITYFTGYVTATDDTFVYVYNPSVLMTYLPTIYKNTGTYTYTATTTLTRTYSSVTKNQIYNSYITYYTKYETQTLSNTLSEINLDNYYTLIKTISAYNSAYYSIINTLSYIMTISSTSVNDFPTQITIKSALVNMTSTFTYIIDKNVTFTYTSFIYGETDVNTSIYTQSTTFIGPFKVLNTDVFIRSNTSVSYITYSITTNYLKTVSSQTFPNLSDAANMLFTKETIGPSLTNAFTQTVFKYLTKHYDFSSKSEIISEIYTYSRIYKSTFINIDYAYTMVQTITKTITKFSSTTILTLLSEPTITKTEFMTSGFISTFVDNSKVISQIQKLQTNVITTNTDYTYYPITTTLSFQIATYYVKKSTLISTFSVIFADTITFTNNQFTTTQFTTIANIYTYSTFSETTFYIADTTILVDIYTRSLLKDQLSFTNSLTNIIKLTLEKTIPSSKISYSTWIPSATSNILVTNTRTTWVTYAVTKTFNVVYTLDVVSLDSGSTSFTTTTNIYTNTYTKDQRNNVVYSYTRATSYYEAYTIVTTPTQINKYVIFRQGVEHVSTFFFTDTISSYEYYSLTFSQTSGLTITSEIIPTQTIFYTGTQIVPKKEFNSLVRVPGYSIVHSTITYTLLESIVKTEIDSYTFSLVPTWGTTFTSYGLITTNKETFTSSTIIPPPRTPSPTNLPTPLPTLRLGNTYTTIKTNSITQTYTESQSIVNKNIGINKGESINISTSTKFSTSTNTIHEGTVTETNEIDTIIKIETKFEGPQNFTIISYPSYSNISTSASVIITTDTQHEYETGSAVITMKTTNVSIPINGTVITESLSSTFSEVQSTVTTIFTYTDTVTKTYTEVITNLGESPTISYTDTMISSVISKQTTLTSGGTIIYSKTSSTINETIVKTFTELETITLTLSLKPTMTPLPSATFGPTPVETPSPSPLPTKTYPPKTPDMTPSTNNASIAFTETKTQTETIVITNSSIITESYTVTTTITSDVIEDKNITYETQTNISTMFVVITQIELVSYSDTYIISVIMLDDTTSKSHLSNGQIILFASIIMGVILVLAMMAVFLYRRSAKQSSDYSDTSAQSMESGVLANFQQETTRTNILDLMTENEDDMISPFNFMTTTVTTDINTTQSTEGGIDLAFGDEDSLYMNAEF